MNTLIYLLQASLLLIGLFGGFWLLLRKETFFQLNRIILLGATLLVLLLPLLPLTPLLPSWELSIASPVTTNIGQTEEPPVVIWTEETGIAITTNEAINHSSSVVPSVNWLQLFLLIYLAGVLLFAARLIFQFALLVRLLLSGKRQSMAPFTLVQTTKKIKPFSFFNFIVYNPATLSGDTLEQVCEHEAIHSRQWHSIDILLGELLCVALWFHPMAWKMAQHMRLNLEYLADYLILNRGYDKKRYQYSLLQVALNGKNLRLTNNFNQSLIKKRIVMMNAKQSPDYLKWKYFLMLPLLFGFALIINQVQAQTTTNTKKSTQQTATSVGVGASTNQSAGTSVTQSQASSGLTGQAQSISGQGVNASANGQNRSTMTFDPEALENADETQENIYFIVRADVNEETLNSMQEDIAKEGITVNIPRLEFNSDGLITSIKIEMDSNNGVNGNVHANNNGQPIEGPVGFYFISRGEKSHFGTINGDPSNARLPKNVIKFIQASTGYFKGDFSGN